MNILEIGDRKLFGRQMPGITTLIWTGKANDAQQPFKCERIGPNVIRTTRNAVREGEYDLVVWHPPEKTPWHEWWNGRRDTRAWQLYFFSRIWDESSKTPLIVFDTRDRADIPAHIFPVLAKCAIYFKREFPLDREKLYPRNASIRQKKVIDENEIKIRPTSLGLDAWKISLMPSDPVPKTSDVFFAGQTQTRARMMDYPKLLSLAESGIRLDLPSEKLTLEEFYRRCAASWLVWSPEGSGWDCFRHYEAACCRSVPVMNAPTIQTHQPLRESEHAFYYDEQKPLDHVIKSALADRNKLIQMAEAGRQHVLLHHTHEALCRMILESALPAGHSGRNA